MTSTALKITEQEVLARMRLLRASAIGPATFHAILKRFQSAERAIKHWTSIATRLRRTQALSLPPVHEIEQELAKIKSYDAQVLVHGTPDYPAALAETENPPPLVIAKGQIAFLNRTSVAIVGSRNSSAIGQRFAKDIARELSESDLVIVSGLARGIDTAAHKGALARGTVAVVAGGINVIYPPENARLHNEIAEAGVILSEVKFDQQPTAQHFPRRNRIISGLSLGVLVVEATLNSGSLITARLAAEQGRDVFAVPGSPLDPRANGTNALLRQGAILTENADDILSALQFAHPCSSPRARSATGPELTPIASRFSTALEEEILHRLSHTPVDTDELIRLIGASPAEVSATLIDLEFAGLLTRHPGQRVALSSGG